MGLLISQANDQLNIIEAAKCSDVVWCRSSWFWCMVTIFPLLHWACEVEEVKSGQPGIWHPHPKCYTEWLINRSQWFTEEGSYSHKINTLGDYSAVSKTSFYQNLLYIMGALSHASVTYQDFEIFLSTAKKCFLLNNCFNNSGIKRISYMHINKQMEWKKWNAFVFLSAKHTIWHALI